MRTLVLCDDKYHPAALTRDGLAALESDYSFDWLEDANNWSAEQLNHYPLSFSPKPTTSLKQMKDPGQLRRLVCPLFIMFSKVALCYFFIQAPPSMTKHPRSAS